MVLGLAAAYFLGRQSAKEEQGSEKGRRPMGAKLRKRVHQLKPEARKHREEEGERHELPAENPRELPTDVNVAEMEEQKRPVEMPVTEPVELPATTELAELPGETGTPKTEKIEQCGHKDTQDSRDTEPVSI